MLDPYEHPDADALMADVERVLDPIRGLVDRVRRDGGDLVYVNDTTATGTPLGGAGLGDEQPVERIAVMKLRRVRIGRCMHTAC